MATLERIRKMQQIADVSFHPALSGFETRCLCRRLADCELSLQQAFVDATDARRKTCDAPTVVRLWQALEATLRQIEGVRQLAVSGLATPIVPGRVSGSTRNRSHAPGLNRKERA